MYPPRREGPLLALLVVMTASLPLWASAEEPEKPPTAEEPPAKQPSAEEAPAEKAPTEQKPPPEGKEERREERHEKREAEREKAVEEAPKDIVTKDAAGKEWITPDVGCRRKKRKRKTASGTSMRSSSSTCRAPIWAEDTVEDAEGKEIEEIPTPVVSKSGRSSGSR